ncbi:MAG: hypothetical protein IH621_05275 [Krumholzibacteria bacterium]|nr:hypothetical protein [Candidatus Krumholzibacteria bacterium]
MFRTSAQLKAVGRACRGRDAAMAHRRPLVRRHTLRLVAGGAALALVIAGTVMVSGEVTRLRNRVGDLEDRRVCLEAASADLALRWMDATSPEAVIPRAERAGLVMPDAPDFVLVAAPAADPADDGFLHRMLAGLAGGATANAAQPPVFVAGTMVSLDPAAAAADPRVARP